jgi:hypothetical protein
METLQSRPSDVGWLGRAGSRVRFHWPTKMLGTVAFMVAFFYCYFWLLNHPRYPVTTIPRIFVDRWVAFRPGAMTLYVSLWAYVVLPPALLGGRREMWTYAVAATAMSAVGFAIFILWPTAVPKPDVAWPEHSQISYLKAVDASGNAFPSLHVAFAVFTAVWLGRLLAEVGAGGLVRALNWLWCAGIVYSTLATRQHVALDALSGAAMGAAGALLHLRILGGLRPGTESP